jgi:hypothetical protein
MESMPERPHVETKTAADRSPAVPSSLGRLGGTFRARGLQDIDLTFDLARVYQPGAPVPARTGSSFGAH